MIIDSPIISGSSAASGSLNQFGNVTITGSLTVTGPIIGVLTGSVNSASFATTASYVSPNTQINTASFAFTASYVSPNTQINSASFATTASYASTVDFNNTVATSSFAFTASYVSPNTQINTASFAITASYVSPNTQINTASFAITASYVSPNTQINTASFAVTASYVSPNTQINTASFATTASYATNAETLDGLDSSVFTLTSSFQNYTSSNDARIASINAFSASILNYTSSTDAKVNALYAFSSSLLSYTSSTDAKIASIYSTTASLNASVASLNTYTSSNSMNVANLFATSASLNANVAGLNAQTASLLSYTSSNDAINTAQNTRLSALEAATASLYTTTASLNASVASLNTYTSSLNAKTASFATTGSNTFTGRQYISDASQASSFTATASLYTDGGLRVSKDAYVSGTLFLNNLTVFGTQSVAYISSSQLNIATNIITVNTSTPSIRFGGLAVQDSGSGATGLTGSILWDSQENHWVYSNPSGSSYSGGMFISGPRSAALGSEQGTTFNALMKGQGGDHITSSGIFESGSGNVGIGTTGPIDKLHIVGGLTSTGLSVPFNSSIGSLQIGYDGTNGVIRTWNSSPLVIQTYNYQSFETSGTERMRITSGGSVGIGSSSPGYKLDVAGNGRFTEQVTAATYLTLSEDGTYTGTYYTLGFSGTSNGANRIFGARDGSDGIYFAAATSRGFEFRANGGTSATLRILSNGNVGIGTASPSADGLTIRREGSDKRTLLQLDRPNNAGLQTNIRFTVADIMVGQIQHEYAASNYNHMSFTLRSPGGSDVIPLWLENSGNVGIGSTSPSYKLDVVGSIKAGSGNTSALLVAATAGGQSMSASIAIQQLTTEGDTIIFADYEPYAEYGIMAKNSVDSIDFIGGPSTGGLTSYSVVNRSGSTRTAYVKTRISLGDGNMYVGGSVGIGTTAPNRKLHINGSSDVRIQITDSDQGVGSSDGMYIRQFGVNTAIVNQENGSLQFGANNNYVMTLLSGGSVGIGTTAPNQQLVVSGSSTDTRVEIGSSSTQGLYFTKNGANNGTFRVDANGNYEFYTKNVSQAVVITVGGNVGIGTTSPAGVLDIVGGSYNTGLIVRSSNTGGTGINLKNTDTGGHDWYVISTASGNGGGAGNLGFYDNTNGNYLMYIKGSDGNVGIGTTNPSFLLNLYGSNAATVYQTSGTGTGAGNGFYVGHTGNVSYVWNYNNFPLVLATNNTERMRIIGDGNVGIGTTSPTSKLYVNGDLTVSAGSIEAFAFGVNSASTFAFGSTNGRRGAIIAHESANDSGLQFGWDTTDKTGIIAGSANVTGAGIDFYTYNGSAWGNRARINKDGNVGIGTTSPNALLNVKGSGNYNGVIAIDNGTTTGGGALFIRQNGVNSGFIGLLGGALGTSDRDFVYYTESGLGHVFFTNDGTRVMTLTSGGNVGIGTTSPGSLLQVGGSGASSASTPTAIQLDNSYRNAVGGNTALKFYLYRSGNETYGIGLNNAGGIEYHSGTVGDAGSYQAFYFGNSEKIRFKGDGNIGIGTTSPATKLQISGVNNDSYGQLRLLATGTGADAQISFETPLNGRGIYVDDSDTNKMKFYTGAGKGVNDMVTFDNSGYVGIGTTSPSYLLDLRTTSTEDAVMAVRNTSTGNAKIYFDAANGDLAGGDYCYIGQNNDLKFYIVTDANAGDIILNPKNGSGNVGIGTTSPSKKLHVVSSANEGIFMEGSSNGGHWFDFKSANSNLWSMGAQPGLMGWYNRTDSSYKVVISDGGNVGIGTTAPDFKLRVQGNGYFSNTLEVAQNIWAYNGIQMYRAGTTVTGISWYNNSYYNWQEYMASAGATSCGPNGNLTAPSGLSAVTAWALRSRMEGVSTYGWIWETSSGGGGDANASPKMELGATNGTLQVSGDMVAYASDGRLKTNVKEITNALDKVKQIRGVEYDWVDDIEEKYGFYPTSKHEVGVIAQEMQKVLPEAVLTAPFNGAYKQKYNEDPNFLTVKYDRIVPLLIEAIKEQQQQIDELKYLLQTINK